MFIYSSPRVFVRDISDSHGARKLVPPRFRGDFPLLFGSDFSFGLGFNSRLMVWYWWG
jgi:hypothetical protein